ncbi:MAG: hypothetical protein XD95_0470 [Microgenomates bacterium 39_7]|nr:MAG: hypothetical protein XD95_0470 [Microgenomates bacterium 39_7]
MIGLLELDIALFLAKKLGLDISVPENVELIQSFLDLMGQVAAEHLTGLVIDPIYSFSASGYSKKNGCVTRLNTLSEEIDPLSPPQLIPDYGLEEISNNYSLAKFELMYHPQEESSLKKKQLLAEIYDYCDYLDMHLLLKLQLYNREGGDYLTETFIEDQLVAVQELSKMTDLIALQNPLDPLSIATLTAELDIPWILINDNQNYDDFKQQLRICLENGASGFIAGQALWQDIAGLKQAEEGLKVDNVTRFIETTFKDRLIELMRIVNEAGDQS